MNIKRPALKSPRQPAWNQLLDMTMLASLNQSLLNHEVFQGSEYPLLHHDVGLRLRDAVIV